MRRDAAHSSLIPGGWVLDYLLELLHELVVALVELAHHVGGDGELRTIRDCGGGRLGEHEDGAGEEVLFDSGVLRDPLALHDVSLVGDGALSQLDLRRAEGVLTEHRGQQLGEGAFDDRWPLHRRSLLPGGAKVLLENALLLDDLRTASSLLQALPEQLDCVVHHSFARLVVGRRLRGAFDVRADDLADLIAGMLEELFFVSKLHRGPV
mmetsp:Transcript_782/g.1934  ORF Transcript_782/g.1934 Transcript_782/m.1934 type:complete len:209 (+) Transcript_782:3275-3901(+)